MSSRLRLRNSPSWNSSCCQRPRKPSSIFLVTTWRRGGSARKALGSRHSRSTRSGSSPRAAAYWRATVKDCSLHASSMGDGVREDRKSTRLNSSHVAISYAVFCLKKKKNYNECEPCRRDGGTRRPRGRRG